MIRCPSSSPCSPRGPCLGCLPFDQLTDFTKGLSQTVQNSIVGIRFGRVSQKVWSCLDNQMAHKQNETKPLAFSRSHLVWPFFQAEVTLKSLVWALVLLALIMYVWGPGKCAVELAGNAEHFIWGHSNEPVLKCGAVVQNLPGILPLYFQKGWLYEDSMTQDPINISLILINIYNI